MFIVITFPVVLSIASEKSKKAMDKFNKGKARAKPMGRGGSSRGNVGAVLKEFSMEVYNYTCMQSCT